MLACFSNVYLRVMYIAFVFLYICMYITDVQVYVLDFISLLKVCDPGMIVVAR